MDEDSTIPVRVSVRLRNNSMVEARSAFRYSQRLLGEMTGVSADRIAQLERFDFTQSDIIAVAKRVAVSLWLEVEDVLPPDMIGEKLMTTFHSVEQIKVNRLLASQKRRFVLPSPADIAEISDEKSFEDKLNMEIISTFPWRARVLLLSHYNLATPNIHIRVIARDILHITKEAAYARRDKWIKELDEKKAARRRTQVTCADARQEAANEIAKWEQLQE